MGGRKVMRVPLDFDWPMHMPWKGYVNPYKAQKCQACKDSVGLSKECGDIYWDVSLENLTQEDVTVLQEQGLLAELINQQPNYQPTVAEVRTYFQIRYKTLPPGSTYPLTEARAKRAGLEYRFCSYCNGDLSIWPSDKVKQLHAQWYTAERYDPPNGEGYQLWEFVSEGSPISPVLATQNELCDYLTREFKLSPEAVAALINTERPSFEAKVTQHGR
jgi:hypothetical protein